MHRLTSTYGHRTVFIWLLSTAWLGIAATILLGDSQRYPELFHTHIPIPIRVCIWVIPALLALAVSRTERQWVGFMVLALPPAQRLASYVIGAGLGYYHHNPMASEWVGRVVVWAMTLFTIWLFSTVQDANELDGILADQEEKI